MALAVAMVAVVEILFFVGEEGLTTLLDLRYNRIIKAQNGQNGMAKIAMAKMVKTYI